MWLEKVGWAYGPGSRVSVQTNANYGSLEGRDHFDSSISFIVTQYSANAMCESWVVISNHTLVLLLLIVQLPGRLCGYCSYGTDGTRVAHSKRKAAAFAARVTASNATAVRETRSERKWLFV